MTDQYVIEGVATTPTVDRAGDIVVPTGAKFTLPLPLLHQHDHRMPVGQVEEMQVSDAGITFRARLAKDATSDELKRRVDLAWDEIKTGLVDSVSIGFGFDDFSTLESGGWKFDEWELRELSLVSIPANPDAKIQAVKSVSDKSRTCSFRIKSMELDGEEIPPAEPKKRAAIGNVSSSKAAETPGVTGKEGRKAVKIDRKSVKTHKKAPEGDKLMADSILEQIEAFEATKTAKSARIDDMVEASAKSGETFSGEETEEYDALVSEIKSIDAHIERLTDLNARKAAAAEPVDGKTAKAGTAARTVAATVKAPKAEKGIAFARYAKSLAISKGNLMQAAEVAKRWEDTPQVGNVLKAAVAAGTTTDPTWAAPLVEYNQMADEFLELLQPATIMGRISGWNFVPFKVSVPRMTSGSTFGWVGEGKHKPVGALAFDNVKLDHHKTAGIVVITDELARLSTPSADRIIRDNMIAQNARFIDAALLDPAVAAVAGVSPASLTNGVAGIASSGTDEIAVRTDMKALIAAYTAANLSLAGATLVMSEVTATSLAFMVNPLGQPSFPGMNMNGGNLLGVPVVVSENLPAGQITLIKANDVFVADDGSVMLDSSSEASLVMDDDPEAVADPKPLVSMWQTNQTAIRAERYISWQKGRAASVQMIAGAAYN